jgi:phosphoribosylformimino-5-aminoimidazole carboxamide ribotide isomerase
MELLPAIDLRAGEAVRLRQGDFALEDRYGDPVALAVRYIDGGARWLHVVDLDAARTGVPHQREVLSDILHTAADRVRVQFGGGIRAEDDAEELLASGVSRVVFGTAALEDPGLAGRCARRWPGQVAVGLDYRVGSDGVAEAQAQGWLAGSGQSVSELLELWAHEPLGAVVATAVARDGMLSGPDLEGLAALLDATTLPVIASGGVSSVSDLGALNALAAAGSAPSTRAPGTTERRLSGAIVGRALADGRFSVEEGVAACAASE